MDDDFAVGEVNAEAHQLSELRELTNEPQHKATPAELDDGSGILKCPAATFDGKRGTHSVITSTV